MKIIGHQRFCSQFSRLLKSGTLNHAYVLLGAEHLGKQTLAKWAASELLNIPIEETIRHPDVRIIIRGYDEKNERFKRDLTVNEIRAAIQFATESSFRGGYKIIIITDADRMNTEAGNALLKMLEEPPSQTIFFLLYETLGAIMPTIRSRSQVLALTPVPAEEMTQALTEAGYQAGEINAAVKAAAGRPGLALTFLQDPESLNAHSQIQADFLALIGAPLAEKFAAAEKLTSEAQENGGVDQLIERLELWQEAAQPSLWPATGAPIPDLVKIHDELKKTIVALRQNAHPRLTVEAFLAAIQ